MQKETRPPVAQGRSLFRRAADALRANRKLEMAVYAALILLVVLLYAGTLLPDAGKRSGTEQAARPADAQGADTEARLQQVLSRIRGAGQVEVMITYETGTELVPAMTKSVDSNSSEVSDEGKSSLTTKVTESSEPATMGGGGEPIVLMEREPVVRGVIVVAEGAADIRVRLDLQRAVQAVLDIPLSRIEVFESALPASGLPGKGS